MKNLIISVRELLMVFLTGILIGVSFPTFSQAPDWEWAKSAGGTDYDRGDAIANSADGNLLVSGFFHGSATFDTTELTSSLALDVFIAKYTTAGDLLWAKSVASSASFAMPSAIYEDPSGNIYLAGTFGVYSPGGGSGDIAFDEVTAFTSWGNQDIFIAKYDPEGNFIWARHIGSSWSDKIASTMDNDGNIIFSGILWSTVYFNSTSDTLDPFHLFDIFLAKYDTIGSLIFYQHAASCTAVIEPQDVTTDDAGNIYLAGKYNGRPTFGLPVDSIDLEEDLFYNQGFIARYEPLLGFFTWAYSAGNTSYTDHPLTVNSTGAGKIIMSGIYIMSASFGFPPTIITLTAPPAAGYGEMYLVQYDTSGSADWAINAGHATGGSLYFRDAYHKGGYLYIAGDYSAGPATFGQGAEAVTIPFVHDLFVANYGETGDLDWVKVAGGYYYEGAESVVTDSLNNIFITGFYDLTCFFPGTSITLTAAGYEDIFVARLDDISVSVYEKELDHDHFIFPNPAREDVTLNLGGVTNCVIQLFNLQGEVLFETKMNTRQIKLDVKDLPQGIYFITVTDKTGNRVMSKMLKM